MIRTDLPHFYALALGSNRPLSGKRTPARLVKEAAARIALLGEIHAIAPILTTTPLGPSLRLYSNSALLIASALPPDKMLGALQGIERSLGRQRHRRWGMRRMDIDIILWSGGSWNSRSLHIPHPAFRTRDFVLKPLHAIAPSWRDPVSGRTVRQLLACLQKATVLPHSRG